MIYEQLGKQCVINTIYFQYIKNFLRILLINITRGFILIVL